ncbi:MAG: pyridoxal-phosphate dependent enzyme, partial [Spirochaetes bacterium]|nr:pyridoxal-phosphate dependent enzyme [Spirochaetota bacterium]
SAPKLYIKRDDYTAYFVGGNKVRKLEYTMAQAMRFEATAVVTVGSFQSNHTRITAMVARRLGLKCCLVLNGDGTVRPSGNYLISRMLGVDVVLVKSRDERLPMMGQVAHDLEARGERVYMIPLGASDEVGSFGLTAGLAEVMDQEKAMDVKFNAILVGSSSGGTQAGLEVGKLLFGREDLRIIGVSPDDPAPGIRAVIANVAGKMLDGLRVPGGLRADDIQVDDSYFGKGYGIPTEASEEATRIFAQTEGILLDPIYTNKAGAALIDYCRKGRFRPTDNVLFWHTGGLIGLFN